MQGAQYRRQLPAVDVFDKPVAPGRVLDTGSFQAEFTIGLPDPVLIGFVLSDGAD